MRLTRHASLVLALSSTIPWAAAQEEASPAPRLVWEDLDADRLPDVLVLAPGRPDLLLRNLGEGRFADETAVAGLDELRSRSVVVDDLDRDGRRDLLSVTQNGTVRLFRNVGGAAFEEATASSGLADLEGAVGATRLDVDGDGWGDLELSFASGEQRVFRSREGGLLEPLELELPAPATTIESAPAAAVSPDGPTPADPQLPTPEGSRLLVAPIHEALGRDLAVAGLEGPALPASVPPTWSASPIFPPSCVSSLEDAAGSGCIGASSVPTLGSLYPLSTDLFVDAGTGRVGIGTTTPARDLDVDGNMRLQGSLYFPDSTTSRPMFFMYGSPSGNARRTLFAHSPSFPNSGLGYDQSNNRFIFGTINSTSPALAVDSSGTEVGIGVSDPQAELHIRDFSGVELFLEADIDNFGEDDQPSIRFSQDGGVVQALVGFQNSENHLAFRNYYSGGGMRFDLHTSSTQNWEFRRQSTTGNDVEARITQPGGLQLDGSVSSPAADLAEFYPVLGAVEPGDVVAFSGDGATLERARPGAEGRLAGVISSRPAFLMGLSYTEEDELGVEPEAFDADERYLGDTSTYRVDRTVTHEIEVNGRAPLALAGRVPVKVTAANGPIRPGDPLTHSSTAGHAAKATDTGVVIGTALEGWSAGEGKILAFVRTGWYAPDPDAGRMSELQRELDDLQERLSRLEGERSPR